MKKLISLLITVCMLSAFFAVPAAAQKTVSSMTVTENAVGTSTVYLGEFRNGNSAVKYIWSEDYLDYSYYHRYDGDNVDLFDADCAAAVAEEAFRTLKTALAGMDDTDYYDLIADVDPATYGNNPLAFCSDPTLVSLMDESWASAAGAGQSIYPGKEPLHRSEASAYDADAGLAAAVDALRAERTADMDFPLTGDEKMIVNHVDSGTVSDVSYQLEDGQLVRYVDMTVWYDAETTDIVLTSADTFIDIDAIADSLNAAIRAHEETVSVSEYNITTDIISEVISALYTRTPYVNSLIQWLSYSYTSAGKVTLLRPGYYYDAETSAARLAEMDAVADSIIAGMPDGASDTEKLLYLHDWLVLNSHYDTTYSVYDAYTILTQGTGVCDAYSKAYMFVCMKLGIPCVKVDSSSMNHAWNRVLVDGEWYHIDVTWDDPTADRLGRVRHIYFLVGDSLFETQNRPHTGFEEGWCTSDLYDGGFWRETNSQIVRLGDSLLYVRSTDTYSGSGYLSEVVDASDGSVVYSFSSLWSAGGGYYWSGSYSGIAVHGSKLLYNTNDAVISWDPATNSTETVYECDGAKQIFALFTDKNGDAVCVLGDDPNGTADERLVLDLPDEILVGDANGDGIIDTIDLTLARQYLAGQETTIGAGADLNTDGTVDTMDLTLLRTVMASAA